MASWSGAAKGAIAGSVVPGVGTAVGGLIGGLLGDDEPDAPAPSAAPGGPQPYNAPTPQYGGYEGGAYDWSQIGLTRMGQANRAQQYAQQGMMGYRGPQARENQTLSNREALTRGWDQAGALQLSREAAMGQAPSQAAYQMQQGLNQAQASQAGMAGGARGAAGLALAQGNAAANTANLQSEAYNQAAQLRAGEMAQARGMYGQLAGQMREQDLARLQMGNQMGQFNAGLNDQYRLGMGNLSNQLRNQDVEWYKAAMAPHQSQFAGDTAAYNTLAGSYDASQALNAGITQAQIDAKQRAQDRMWALFGTLIQAGGKAGAAAAGAPGAF